MIVLRRIIKSGFANFKRNGSVSFAGVLQVMNTLAVITTIILLHAVLYSALTQIKDKVDVTIYLTFGADEEKIMLLKSSLEKLPEVAEVTYTPADEVLRIFRERHAKDYPTIQALDELNKNPLNPQLNVRAKEVAQYESIANFLKSDNALVLGSTNIVDHANYSDNKLVIGKLNEIIAGANKLSLILTLYLIISSIIITFNTIRLTIFISKEEIGVMRLVGASKMSINGPFMVEGAMYGIIATVVTLIVFWPITAWLGGNSDMTAFLGIDLSSYYFSNIIQIFIILLLSGVCLGVVSSVLAARKYLNK
jgi:cell division transport system permease protein